MKFPYEWWLEDGFPAEDVKYHGTSVFSCFAGGGGSSMGYKLAGYDVVGCNEIDPRMMECYTANLKPCYAYECPIQELTKSNELLRNIKGVEVLDGSPPCSSFSMAGNRQKDWGKKKKFREGQQEQVLDTLFFDFIELVGLLNPKIVICENVKGLLQGKALNYLSKICHRFRSLGYLVCYHLLDASVMGLPQRRERVFFLAVKEKEHKGRIKGLLQPEPLINLHFNMEAIPFKEICDNSDTETNIMPSALPYWQKIKHGSLSKVHPKGSFFSEIKLDPAKPANTITGKHSIYHHKYPRKLNKLEICLASSFPLDYDFRKSKCGYVCGMSVPPIMMAQVATRVKDQWLI